MDYHNQPHQTHFPPAHYPPTYHQDTGPRRSRSRSSSNTTSESLPHSTHSTTHQPLNNALNNAFDKSDSASRVDPDLIAQITAEVTKSVMEEIKMQSGIGATNPAPPQSFPPSTTSLPPRNVYTPPSPKHVDPFTHNSPPPDPVTRDVRESSLDATDETSIPRYEQASREQTAPRPVPPRMSTEETYTPIEKMWQRLFDLSGQPTDRLSQFLRGLAVHLIEDYEPKNSLVISPAKMLKFYKDVEISDEVYPWAKIFGELPYSTLCKIYRDLRCQHHLIQEHNADQPHIPALTPDGFREWMTIMIQAYPSNEYDRLSKAVLDMPISNADDRKERFPKELPRRLFPQQENLHAQQRCAAALSAEGVGPLRRAPTFPPPPPKGQTAGTTASLERERSPYAGRPDPVPAEFDEDREEPLSKPIERERKPYAAAPGGGKVYGDEHRHSVPSESAIHEQRRRTQSTASQNPWVPPPNMSQPQQQARAEPQPTGRRPRSPSFSNFARSDPSVRDVPNAYYASNVYNAEEDNRRFARDAEKRREEWSGRHNDGQHAHHRRSTAGTDSSYDSQPRSVYDDDYYRSGNGGSGYDNRYDSRRY
ncbi:unnamed protein product [Periconia digitata]|uniref:DUF7514 domain-containing protein n=1 Tax=Periconia digitata TaxID=1303443 RepID=A0A9W4U504_9PLEO|nr:unnamed protein product [Periconia digitata]